MGEYKLELKQVVEYPRCRVYRQFIHSIIGINNLRVGRSSGLYYYTVLACHQISEQRTIESGVSHTRYIPESGFVDLKKS